MTNQAERVLIARDLELAQQDLRETVAEAAHTVRRAEERLSLRKAIERHPFVASFTALALGFLLADGDG
jgi:hypothetical protein